MKKPLQAKAEKGLAEQIVRGVRRKRRRRSRRAGGEGDVTIGDMPVAFDDESGDSDGSGARDVFVGTAGRHIARRGTQLLVHPVATGADEAAMAVSASAARKRGAGGGGGITEVGRGAFASGSGLVPLKFDFKASKTTMPATRCGTGFLHGFTKKPGEVKKGQETFQTFQSRLEHEIVPLRPTLFRVSHYDAGLFPIFPKGQKPSSAQAELQFYKGYGKDGWGDKVTHFGLAALAVLRGEPANKWPKPSFQVVLGNAWGIADNSTTEGLVNVPPSFFNKNENDKWRLKQLWPETVKAVMDAIPPQHTDRYEIDIYNEPNHGTFSHAFEKTNDPGKPVSEVNLEKNPKEVSRRFNNFFQVWSAAVEVIRAHPKKVMVVGPSLSGKWGKFGSGSWMEQFLSKCKRKQIPDIVSWHNLGTKPEINQYVKELIKYCAEKRNKSKFRRVPRVDVNETMGGSKGDDWKSWCSPGTTVHFLADAERANFTIQSYSRRKRIKPPAGKPPFVRICRSRHGGQQDTVSDLKAAWYVLRCYAEMGSRIFRVNRIKGHLDWIISFGKGPNDEVKKVRLLVGRNDKRHKPKAALRIELSNLPTELTDNGYTMEVEWIRHVDNSNMTIDPNRKPRMLKFDGNTKKDCGKSKKLQYVFPPQQGLRGWDALFITLTPKTPLSV